MVTPIWLLSHPVPGKFTAADAHTGPSATASLGPHREHPLSASTQGVPHQAPHLANLQVNQRVRLHWLREAVNGRCVWGQG